jgi:hypothetical protein
MKNRIGKSVLQYQRLPIIFEKSWRHCKQFFLSSRCEQLIPGLLFKNQETTNERDWIAETNESRRSHWHRSWPRPSACSRILLCQELRTIGMKQPFLEFS